jgi:hypothetical protein
VSSPTPTPSRSRARATLAVALVALAVLGGASVAGAATAPWWFPRPTTTTTTTAAPVTPAASGSSIGCPSSQQNYLLSSGDTYTVATDPGVTFTIATSSISWKPRSSSDKQTRVVSFYSKAGFVTYAGAGPSSITTSSSSLGKLGSVTVCTTIPATPSPTVAPPAPGSGGCPAGQLPNTVVWAGDRYLDSNSPTLNITIGTSSISWTRVGAAVVKGGTASYQQGAVAVPSGASSAVINGAKGKLLALVVCTTPS